MRELKFRAWDEEKKRMLYSTESYDYGNTEFRFIDGELFIVAKLDCGFVLRHISSYGHSGFDTPNCIIKGWPIIDNYTLWNHQRSLVYKGNIYENPELLEVENG